MQLLTNTNYSIQYQCYSDSEDNSWSGSMDFTVDKEYEDLMDWFKSERKDIIENLCKYRTDQGREPNLEAFWFMITDGGNDAIAGDDPLAFIQWHKHPKRMSEYGRDTLKRLTADDGLYSLLGLHSEIGDVGNLTTLQFPLLA